MFNHTSPSGSWHCRAAFHPACYCLSWPLMALLGLSSAHAGESLGGLFPGTSARLELREKYVPSLGLEKMTVATGQEKLLAEGYQCGLYHGHINPFSEVVPLSKSSLWCTRKPSGFSGCYRLDLTIDWDTGETIDSVLSFQQALDQIGKSVVGSSYLDCSPASFAVNVVPRWVVPKPQADERFNAYVKGLALHGLKPRDAWQQLLAHGFSCAIGASKYTPETDVLPSVLSCAAERFADTNSERYFDIQCYRPTVTLTIKTPAPVATRKDILDQLDNSTVSDVHAECKLPENVAGDAL